MSYGIDLEEIDVDGAVRETAEPFQATPVLAS